MNPDSQAQKRPRIPTASSSPTLSREVLELFNDTEVNKKPMWMGFHQLSSEKYKRKVRTAIASEVMNVFSKYNMITVDDMMETWNLVAKEYIGFDKIASSSFVDAFTAQEKSLSLQDRYMLYRLLTHKPPKNEDDVAVINEDMIKFFPFLRKKSEHVLFLDDNGRKERSDKIDMQFISDYMHDYCR